MRRRMRRKKPRATAKIWGMTSLTVGLPPLAVQLPAVAYPTICYDRPYVTTGHMLRQERTDHSLSLRNLNLIDVSQVLARRLKDDLVTSARDQVHVHY